MTALIKQPLLKKTAPRLINYSEELQDIVRGGGYGAPEGALNLPFDAPLAREIKRMVQKTVSRRLKYIVVIGIGGSNLGALAVYQALRGRFAGFKKDRLPKMLFLDTVDPRLFGDVSKILKESVRRPEEVLVNLITKSGTTTESLANFEALYAILKRRFGARARERVVITTGRESALFEEARTHGFKTLDIPEKVGGRYSVFSSVGLFPLAAAGVDTALLTRGARDAVKQCTVYDLKRNRALISACLLYLQYKKGLGIYNTFFFNPELKALGAWYQQLMSESIGKERDVHGRVVHEGIMPVVSIGTTDLHSMAQLYFGGPRTIFTHFVYARDRGGLAAAVPRTPVLKGAGMGGVSFGKIMETTFEGVMRSYQTHKLPYIETRLPVLDEGALGYYMQCSMIEMMYLAKLLNVNAFDQPGVEDYKNETRRLLSRRA